MSCPIQTGGCMEDYSQCDDRCGDLGSCQGCYELLSSGSTPPYTCTYSETRIYRCYGDIEKLGPRLFVPIVGVILFVFLLIAWWQYRIYRKRLTQFMNSRAELESCGIEPGLVSAKVVLCPHCANHCVPPTMRRTKVLNATGAVVGSVLIVGGGANGPVRQVAGSESLELPPTPVIDMKSDEKSTDPASTAPPVQPHTTEEEIPVPVFTCPKCQRSVVVPPDFQKSILELLSRRGESPPAPIIRVPLRPPVPQSLPVVAPIALAGDGAGSIAGVSSLAAANASPRNVTIDVPANTTSTAGV